MLKLKYAVASDRGLVRGNNEDSAYAGPHLLALADGMGGHAAGEIASQTMINHLRALDVDPGDNDMLALVGMVAGEANAALLEHISCGFLAVVGVAQNGGEREENDANRQQNREC